MVVVHIDERHAFGHGHEEEDSLRHARDLEASVRSTGFDGEVVVLGLEEVFRSGEKEEKRSRLRCLMEVRPNQPDVSHT